MTTRVHLREREWLVYPAAVAVIGLMYWWKSGGDFFDSGRYSWLIVAGCALVSAASLFLILRLLGVPTGGARRGSILAGSLWMLGLPGVAYIGLFLLLPLETLLAGLVVDFGSGLGMVKSLALAATTRCAALLAAAYVSPAVWS